MAVKSGKTADLYAACLLCAELEAGFVAVLKMVMPHIGRIADDEIESW